MNETDVYPSYLPLPHLMERCVSLVLFFYGGAMMYDIQYSDARAEMY